jgi:integrase
MSVTVGRLWAMCGQRGDRPIATRRGHLCHTYASLCVAAGIPPLEISRFMGHANVTTTLTVYTHLFADDHSDAMAALGAIAVPKRRAGNVIRLRVGKSAAGPF